jgi:hypothetical protein
MAVDADITEQAVLAALSRAGGEAWMGALVRE